MKIDCKKLNGAFTVCDCLGCMHYSDSLNQNDSFDETWSLNPSEKRNQKIKKSIEISIEDCKKP